MHANIWRSAALFISSMAMVGCSSTESEADVAITAAPTVASGEATATDTISPARSPALERTDPTLPDLEPATLDDVLPVVCDFERYNGLRVKQDGTDTNPAGYEQSLDVFVRLVLGDRSLPTDASSTALIEAEQARCDALANLTFANGSHPVGSQIEATTFRTLVPVQQACSWQRRTEGDIVEDNAVEAGSIVEIVVEPTDRSIRIDGCGIFVAGTPPVER